MPSITINDVTIEVPDGTNVIQAAEMSGQEIAHYCYHPGLSVAGNCRMCLVEIKALSSKQPNGLPKLQIGCNTIVQDGMVIESENEKVRDARRGVLEFLLINHPIDCPICDQAGECKLQEYYIDYGGHDSRFELKSKTEKHKAVAIGPGVMLDQERCILCTRCVRFLEEVTETHELTIHERGDHSELSLAHGKSVDNPYAANIVDICPVGALTSREFRFEARVWYLQSTPSVCTGCSTGCNIEVHSRAGSIYRVKPRSNFEVNDYWMCDYGRAIFSDNGRADRLLSSLSRESGGFVNARFEDAALRSARALQSEPGPIAVVASADLSLEEGFLLGEIAEQLGGGLKIITSPASSEFCDDGFLISEDRHPNRQGLLALGYVEARRLHKSVNRLLVARDNPAAGEESWDAYLESAGATIVISDNFDETTAYADHVIAVGSHFESDGTFMNGKGRVQRFAKAVDAPTGAVEGWRALGYVLGALGGTRYESAEEVFTALAARHLGLSGIGYDALGNDGVQSGVSAQWAGASVPLDAAALDR